VDYAFFVWDLAARDFGTHVSWFDWADYATPEDVKIAA
jgi:hypothetical protein